MFINSSHHDVTNNDIKQIQDCFDTFLERQHLSILPREVLEQIFDFAGLWPTCKISSNKSISGENLNILHLVSHEVPQGTICKQIEVIVWSHDQGWSSYPQNSGTYNGSWTWGEIIAIPSNLEHTVQQCIQIQKQYNNPDENSTTNGFSRSSAVPTELQEVPSYFVYCNLVARSHWQRHVKVFDMKHELVQGLKSGDRIGLVLRSLYPGWQNYVKWCQIRVSYMPDE
jgi:hypothetical protein